ncbi:MAG: hypothetical protein ACI8RZ_003240 [Myxococcota bacterium]
MVAVRTHTPGSDGVPISTRQVTEADLDGDGLSDTIFTAFADNEAEPMDPVFGGLVVRWGRAGVAQTVLGYGNLEQRILAVSDLDANGQSELLMYGRFWAEVRGASRLIGAAHRESDATRYYAHLDR